MAQTRSKHRQVLVIGSLIIVAIIAGYIMVLNGLVTGQLPNTQQSNNTPLKQQPYTTPAPTTLDLQMATVDSSTNDNSPAASEPFSSGGMAQSGQQLETLIKQQRQTKAAKPISSPKNLSQSKSQR